MALPSARRPVFVEEELQVVREEQLRQALKFKLPPKYQLFQDMMAEWYENQLTTKERNRLTLKKFKRVVICKLHQLNYEYKSLPQDWVQTLVDKHNIQFFRRKKRFDATTIPEGQVLLKVDPLLVKPTKGSRPLKCEWEEVQNASGASEVKTEIMSDSDEVDGSCSAKRIKIDVKSESEGAEGEHGHEVVQPKSEPMSESEIGATTQQKHPKKIIDLTDEPPPQFWIQAYADGIHLPRFLTFTSCDDVNILFYDYKPKFKEVDLKCMTQRVHDANGFSWFPKEGGK